MTRLLPPTTAGIGQAAAMLRDGHLVAFGTETVYGLGGRADRPDTVAAIYAAKHRPAHNPLICHYPTAAAAEADVVFTDTARLLARIFWPGPLTLVLPRRPTTRIAAGVGPAETLAVRVPGAEIARHLLAQAGIPIAAPSANLSGRVSPTTAAHVLESLAGRIHAVLDAGPCELGLESTVIQLGHAPPRLLRPGAIPTESITRLIGPLASPSDAHPHAPGMLPSHYAPKLPLRLNATTCAANEALLAFGPPIGTPGAVFQLSLTKNPAEAAPRLYQALRQLDASGLKTIAAMPIPPAGLGATLNDRLTRAVKKEEKPELRKTPRARDKG